MLCFFFRFPQVFHLCVQQNSYQMKYCNWIASSRIILHCKSWKKSMSQEDHPWVSFSGIFYFVLQFPDNANWVARLFLLVFFSIFNRLFLKWAKYKKHSGVPIFIHLHHSKPRRKKKVTVNKIMCCKSLNKLCLLNSNQSLNQHANCFQDLCHLWSFWIWKVHFIKASFQWISRYFRFQYFS